jgi:hypothetical protein
VSSWISQQTRPVVVLHHETPSANHYINRPRILTTTNSSSSNVTALTEFQISQYQVTAMRCSSILFELGLFFLDLLVDWSDDGFVGVFCHLWSR